MRIPALRTAMFVATLVSLAVMRAWATEPNNTVGTAQPLTLGVAATEFISPSTDVDWFRFTVPPSTSLTTLTVTVDVPSGLNYDVYVYGPDSTLIPAGTGQFGTGIDEVVNIILAAPGTYYALVNGFSGAWSSTAAFTIRASLAPAPMFTTPSPLPPATVGQPYNILFQATGGKSPYEWFLDPNSTLPFGLGIPNNIIGGLVGTPQYAGTYSFGIRVFGADGYWSQKNFSLTIAPGPPTITTSFWPPGIVGETYRLTLEAMGGGTPYLWSISSIPPGLSYNSSTGVVSGIPTAGGTFTLGVRVTGSNGLFSDRVYTVTMRLISNDPLLSNQWHLKSRSTAAGAANVTGAWDTTKGAGVTIGIVDDGVELTHADLQANAVSGLSFDFNNNDSDPAPGSADHHGTAVAGVAAARGDNGIGVSGVAPQASVAGLRLLSAPTTDAQEAAALSHQLGAIHVSNNSWGPTDDGRNVRGPGPLAAAAIENAGRTGRNGKGRVFVWSAGNGATASDNCNFDGYANHRFAIAVGAIHELQGASYYSEPCSSLFVVAPSSGTGGFQRGLTTTDRSGSAGYSTTDYTADFGGTSGAAPVVSGVVALMLARNPALGWRDVQHILRRTSNRFGLPATGWTSGSFPHHEQFGFGQIDATAAVAAAATWPNVAAERSLITDLRSVNRAIPDNDSAGITDSIQISPSTFSIEHVEVEFTATHTWRGNLEVTLTSPSGTVSRLATQRPNDDSDEGFAAWRFTSVRHWGESAAGTWRLQVTDRTGGDAGSWVSWRLRFYGTRPLTDETLTAGMLIRAVHIQELREAIDDARSRLGLPSYSWTDPTLGVGVTPIRAQHILDLRTALRDAYSAAGRILPGFTDPGLGPGTSMKAVHITELRAAVAALE